MNDNRRRFLPSFARTRVRGLKASHKHYLEDVLPRHAVTEHTDWEALTTSYEAIYFEIGFGAGEHLVNRAAELPGSLFIGAEVYDEGMARAVKKVDDLALSNVLLTQEDARLVLERLPDDYLDGVYILFPDPWPKTRHHKRRIVNPPLLTLLEATLRPGGFLQLATDHEGYLEWICVQMLQRKPFRFTARRPADWLNPPEGHITTRYQQKNKSGSDRSYFLLYELEK